MDFAYGTPVHDGNMFLFGSLSLQVLETPGHTEESISLVVRDEKSGNEPYLVFSGDTIFAGHIARTDFFGNARKEEMAGRIYGSITQKILSIGDGVSSVPPMAQDPYAAVGLQTILLQRAVTTKQQIP